MKGKHQAIVLPILFIGSAVYAWSAVKQDTTPAAEVMNKQETSSSSPSQATDAKKAEKDSTHKTHIRLGAITVGAGYSHFSGGPFGYPFGLYRFAYSPFFWDPLWGPYSTMYYPGPFGGLQAADGKGKIQLTSDSGKAEVFLDGAYAGPAQNLKKFWLDPGAYDLSLRAENRAPFHARIYVLSGKTLKVNAILVPQRPSEVKP